MNTHDGEEQFLASDDAAQFDRPSTAVDVVLLTVIEGALEVALLERTTHPGRGSWALPGGFIQIEEPLDRAAARVLAEKAALSDVYLEQLYTFGALDRDPRTRVISVAYCALVDPDRLVPIRSDCRLAFARIEVPWEGEAGGPVVARDPQGRDLPLAFDHADILGMAVKRLRGKLDYTPIGFQFLPDAFTLRRLQDVHETILGRALNKDSFRRRMLSSGQLEATGERESQVGHRPAELYRFARRSAI